jgi:hypothetical protein
MIARLGNVLYWGASGLAAVLIAFAAYVALAFDYSDRLPVAGMFGFGGVAVWLIGRALLYVMAGR